MAGKVYAGDVGTLIRVDVGRDITGSSTAQLIVVKDGKRQSWNGTPNGQFIEYTTTGADIKTPGKYLVRSYVELGSWKGHGESEMLIVYPV